MRWMIIAIACLVAGGLWFKWSHPRATTDARPVRDGHEAERERMAESLREMNKRMPMSVSPMVRIDHMDLVNNVALVFVTQSGVFEPTDDAKAAFAKTMKEGYCHGDLKQALLANVSLEVDLKTPARNLDEPFGKTWVYTISPAQCG